MTKSSLSVNNIENQTELKKDVGCNSSAAPLCPLRSKSRGPGEGLWSMPHVTVCTANTKLLTPTLHQFSGHPVNDNFGSVQCRWPYRNLPQVLRSKWRFHIKINLHSLEGRQHKNQSNTNIVTHRRSSKRIGWVQSTAWSAITRGCCCSC